jgi:hypothetical protein
MNVCRTLSNLTYNIEPDLQKPASSDHSSSATKSVILSEAYFSEAEGPASRSELPLAAGAKTRLYLRHLRHG